MKKEVVILVAEDDEGHAALIEKNLRRASVSNEIVFFRDGQEILDYLLQNEKEVKRPSEGSFLLLLDIRMPKVDGIEVLRQIKQDDELRKLPVVILTTTNDPREVEACYQLGCNHYIVKPVDYEKLIDVVKRLGFFLMVVEVPMINGTRKMN